MILSISEQTRLFFLMVLSGAFVGITYDIFRIIRKIFPHPNFLIQIEDIVYWVIATFGTFYFILIVNDGAVRAYSIVGSILGMILYFFTLSKIVMKISVLIIDFFKKVFIAMFKIISVPFKVLLNILMIPMCFLKHLLIKTKKPVKKVLQNSKSYAKIKKERFSKELKIITKKI